MGRNGPSWQSKRKLGQTNFWGVDTFLACHFQESDTSLFVWAHTVFFSLVQNTLSSRLSRYQLLHSVFKDVFYARASAPTPFPHANFVTRFWEPLDWFLSGFNRKVHSWELIRPVQYLGHLAKTWAGPPFEVCWGEFIGLGLAQCWSDTQ